MNPATGVASGDTFGWELPAWEPSQAFSPSGSFELLPTPPPPAVPPTAERAEIEAQPVETHSTPPGATSSPMDEAAWDDGALWLPEGWQDWFVAKFWSGSLEIGINSTEGNAEAFSSRFGGNLKRKSQLWELKADATYAKSTANGTETQHNAILNTGYERMFGETAWSHFGKFNLEYDEFKAFDLRVVMNMGFGYQLLKSDTTLFKTRVGGGTSHEINSPDPRWVGEAVFGLDLNHQLSNRHKLAFTSDYFPEWDDFANYRLVTDASWTVALDDASKLSLKLSVNERYDSTPNGRKPTDVIYALLLLWQL